MIGSTRLTSGSVPPQLLEFARWRQIRYCLLGLGADGHSAGALQIRGSGGMEGRWVRGRLFFNVGVDSRLARGTRRSSALQMIVRVGAP